MKAKCKKERCCCKCSSQLQLMKHPCNKTIGVGAMSDPLGWVCLAYVSEGKAIFFENPHGECEVFNQNH